MTPRVLDDIKSFGYLSSYSIWPFMPHKCLAKSMPSLLQVVDVLENGTKRKCVLFYYTHIVTDPFAFRQKELLAPFLTAARMIPLQIDIWHNLERIFLAGISGDEGENEAERYTPHPLLVLYCNFLQWIYHP
jgi:hypothetical protein